MCTYAKEQNLTNGVNMKYTMLLSYSFIGLISVMIASVSWASDNDIIADKVTGTLSVMVLGSGGPMAMANGRASAGYLIFIDGNPRILMDVGGGTYQRVAQSGVNIHKLDTILLSHLHIDHTGDLSAVIKTIYFHNNLTRNINSELPGRTASINIYGPTSTSFPDKPGGKFPGTNTLQYPSTADYVHSHYSVAKGGVERYLNAFARAMSGGASNFSYTANDLSSDWMLRTRSNANLDSSGIETVLDIGGLKITAIAVNHGPVPAVGFRIDYKGHSVAYTGDISSKTNNMSVLAKNVDLLIYDTAITETLPLNKMFHALHSEPKRIGEVAAAANASTLLLSHITPITEPRIDAVKSTISKSFSGKIKVAKDLQVYNLGGR